MIWPLKYEALISPPGGSTATPGVTGSYPPYRTQAYPILQPDSPKPGTYWEIYGIEFCFITALVFSGAPAGTSLVEREWRIHLMKGDNLPLWSAEFQEFNGMSGFTYGATNAIFSENMHLSADLQNPIKFKPGDQFQWVADISSPYNSSNLQWLELDICGMMQYVGNPGQPYAVREIPGAFHYNIKNEDGRVLS